MKILAAMALVVPLILAAPSAFAYQLKKQADNSPCTADGSQCNVICDDGHLAGMMHWDGSMWTDGKEWSPDEYEEAEKVVRAYAPDCN